MQKILSMHKTLATIFGVFVLVLMFLIVIDAGGRFLFNRPLQGAVEISKVVLAWILFLPLAYALVQGTHVQVTILLMRLPRRPHLVADTAIAILSLGFFALAIYAGWLLFEDSFRVRETMAAPIWIPFWLAKAALPIGSLLIAVQLGIDLVTNLRQSRRGS